MIGPLAKELFEMYAERPTRVLYHYTSLTGLMGIVENGSLYATDIRFFNDVFEEIEGDLLRVAALLKHPGFSEEDEWRAVSPITSNYVEAPICHREGRSMLLPYIRFALPKAEGGALAIEHAFLGPTPNAGQPMTSLSRYLSKYRANPTKGLTYCQIPYRDW